MKIKFSLIASVFLILLAVTCPAPAQDKITFKLVPPPNGIHPGSLAGVQDPQGYMWIGTYQAPLRRYDGYHYTFYANDPLDSNSLAGSHVRTLFAAPNGYLGRLLGAWSRQTGSINR